MEAHVYTTLDSAAEDDASTPSAPELPRTETGLRLLYSAVFAVILHIVAGMLTLLVVFQLAFALATRKSPHPRLQAFGETLGRYMRQVLGYVTYNDPDPPFPFDDLPESEAPKA